MSCGQSPCVLAEDGLDVVVPVEPEASVLPELLVLLPVALLLLAPASDESPDAPSELPVPAPSVLPEDERRAGRDWNRMRFQTSAR